MKKLLMTVARAHLSAQIAALQQGTRGLIVAVCAALSSTEYFLIC